MRGTWAVLFSMALAGCGGDDDGSGKLSDAPPTADAAIDGMPAMDDPVTLTVTFGGGPRPGVHVYFLDADGTVVKTTDTGADGVASAVMAAGGSVTALDPFPKPIIDDAAAVGDNELVTYLGVKPGDHLALTQSSNDNVSFVLEVSPVDGATDYDVFTTCGTDSLSTGGGGGELTESGRVVFRGCGAAIDVAVLARRSDGESPTEILSGLYQANAMIPTDDSALTLDDAFTETTKVSIMYDNPPPDVLLRVVHAPLVGHGALGPFRVNMEDGLVTEPKVNTIYSATQLVFDREFSQHRVIDWGMAAATYKLDLANLLLPDLLARPEYDFATGKVTWSEAEAGATPNTTIARVEASRESASRSWGWLVISPYSRNELKLPALPTDVADWIPVDGDTASIDHVSNLSVSGGYDALRARTIDITRLNDGSGLGLIAGLTGRIISVQSNDFSPEVGPGRPARPSWLGKSLIRRAVGHSPSAFSPRR